MKGKAWVFIAVLCIMVLALPIACGKKEAGKKGEITIFSWWTSGGEADGLKSLIDFFQQKNPGVEVINAAVAGGAGTNAKAVLKTRMMGGDPPDSFQVHGGAELIDTWVKPGLMEPITDLYASENWNGQFPQALVDMVSYNGQIYAVPSNVHRGNVLWINKAVFDANGLTPPKTFDDFFAVAAKLKSAGITPLALASRNKWEVTHLFECILLGVGGPQFYRDLFAGKAVWTDGRVGQALYNLGKMVDFSNQDHAALTWDQACGLVQSGKAAMTIMGDWAKGYFMANKWVPDKDFIAVPAPGTAGNFIVVTDTFGLPKGAKNPAGAREFLKVVGSVEGQIAFNLKKGSIPSRLNVPSDAFDPIAKATMLDFASNALVPSCTHGSAAPELFVTTLNDELSVFIEKKVIDDALRALAAASIDAGLRPKGAEEAKGLQPANAAQPAAPAAAPAQQAPAPVQEKGTPIKVIKPAIKTTPQIKGGK